MDDIKKVKLVVSEDDSRKASKAVRAYLLASLFCHEISRLKNY